MERDWRDWPDCGSLQLTQIETAAASLAAGWHPEYLATEPQLGAGLRADQLLALHSFLQSGSPRTFDREGWLEIARQQPDLAARSPSWRACVAQKVVSQGQLQWPAGQGDSWRAPSRISPRDILERAQDDAPATWKFDEAAIRQALSLDEELGPEIAKSCLDRTFPAIGDAAWEAVVEDARKKVADWASRIVRRACRTTPRPLPVVAVQGVAALEAVAVAVAADGTCVQERKLTLSDANSTLSNLAALADSVGAELVLLYPDVAGARCTRMLSSSERPLAWRTIQQLGGQWWATSLRASTEHQSVSPVARAALFLALVYQAPLETLGELPAEEAVPQELRPWLDDAGRQLVERTLDAAVHELGLDLRRAGARSIARLCVVSPLHAQRAQAPADGWRNLEQFRNSLRLGDRQWQQTIPFVRLDAETKLAEAPDPLVRDELLRWEQLQVGQRRQALVLRAAQFGLFVDIGAEVEALLHVSEIASQFVCDPLERLAPGDAVEVTIRNLDPAKRHVAVSTVGAAKAQPAARTTSDRTESPRHRGGARTDKRTDKRRQSGARKNQKERSVRSRAKPPAPLTKEMLGRKSAVAIFR